MLFMPARSDSLVDCWTWDVTEPEVLGCPATPERPSENQSRPLTRTHLHAECQYCPLARVPIARQIRLAVQHWLEPVSNRVTPLTSKHQPNDTGALDPPTGESNGSQRVGTLIAMGRVRKPNSQTAVREARGENAGIDNRLRGARSSGGAVSPAQADRSDNFGDA